MHRESPFFIAFDKERLAAGTNIFKHVFQSQMKELSTKNQFGYRVAIVANHV